MFRRVTAVCAILAICGGNSFANPDIGVPATHVVAQATPLDALTTRSTRLHQTASVNTPTPPPASYPAYVATYHYDNSRTGWDSAEVNLTQANAGQVQLQNVTPLSGQIDAEPLYVAAVNLGSNGVHDLVYVATENNWVYAVDANSGIIVLRRYLGQPVPATELPEQCTNNADAVGIDSTPVIDPATGNIYLIAYTYLNKTPTFTLHALSLATLGDTVTPRVVAATGRLANGATYSFNAAITRQRPALLLSRGDIYAGFGSFCDSTSRGWVMGWHEANLAPLGAPDLANSNSSSPDNVFLTSIWMSGFGLAADSNGSIYFATANSDPSGDSWSAANNLEESVVKMASMLGGVQSYYTPNNANWGQKAADPIDADLGSGGVMLLPTQPGAYPHLAVAGGKISGVLLLNRDNLGGYGNGQLDQNGHIGYCWCGSSYYADASGVGHVVTSFGEAVQTFSIRTSPTPAFTNQITSPNISTGQDAGFFTTVSSHGSLAGSAVIWAVSRPVDAYPGYVNLYAFSPDTGQELLAIRAGIWLSPQADADLVPTVANGHIFVASYNQLAMFGLGTPRTFVEIAAQKPPAEMPLAADAPHQLSGTVLTSAAGSFTLRTRTGVVEVDASGATHFGSERLSVGTPLLARGTYTVAGFKAVHILHLKPQPALWPRDR